MRQWLRKRRKWVYAAGYAVLFFTAFVFFAYLSFPYDRLRRYIVQEVNAPKGPRGVSSGYELSIADMGPSWLWGVSMEQVHLRRAELKPDDPAFEIYADKVDAQISLLSMLFGTLSVDVDAEVGQGSAEIEYTQSGQDQSLDAEMDELALGALFPKGVMGLPLQGNLNGNIELELPAVAKDTQGQIELTIKKLVLGDGKAELKLKELGMGLAFDRTNAGDLEVRIPIQNGVAHIEQFEAKGPDMEVAGTGDLRLQTPLPRSRIEMMIRFHFTQSYRKAHDWVEGLYSLIELSPQLRVARASDGALQYKVQGTLSGPVRMIAAGRTVMKKK